MSNLLTLIMPSLEGSVIYIWYQMFMGGRSRVRNNQSEATKILAERKKEDQWKLGIRKAKGIVKVKVLVAQLCLTLCDPMNYSLPGSSVHGNLQARILEWIAIPFSRGSSRPRNHTLVSCIAGRFITI